MLTLDDRRINFHRDRCIQCAVCLPSCPTDALSRQPNKLGFFDIVCDHEACILCNICVKVCPPNWLPDDRATEEQVRNAPGLYLAHAQDERVRWMSSSGGVARTIISEVLARGKVDAVYSLLYPGGPEENYNGTKSNTPWELTERVFPTGGEVEGTWFTTAVRKERVPCSIYRPVLWGSGLNRGDKAWRRVLLVGLPCQLKGAERLLKKLLPRTQLLKVAIFCRKQKVLGHSECVKKLAGFPDVKTELVYYRGSGWPGKSGVYSRGQSSDVDYFFHAKAFTLPGCHACVDCLCAGSADITLTDPWGIVRKEDDPAGSNLVFAWTQAGRELLEQLGSAIAAKPCAADDAVRCVDFDGQVAEKLRVMPYYLGKEASSTGRLRGLLTVLGTRIAEAQLRIMHPNALPIRVQLAIKGNLRAAARLVARIVFGKQL